MAVLWASLLVAACTPTRLACAPGTTLRDGKCLGDDVISCGDGTARVDGQCVAGSDAGSQDDGGSDIGTDGDISSPDATLDELGGDVACVPFCIGRVCGSDGCGGTCGTCTDPAKPSCNDTLGQCQAVCVPQCTGKACGPDGCGGTCGTCASGVTCTAAGGCLPDAWTCNKAFFGDGAVCDCGCGAADSDCAGDLPVAGCAKLQKCDKTGTCVAKVPTGWTCEPGTYDALDACDCGCGVLDPDCQFKSLTVVGCPGLDPACDATGTCVACVPDCTGKDCGNDGCGGSCGGCASKTAVCSAGTCSEPCSPKPLICLTNECGDDGCGGSCGSCATGSTCKFGSCVKVVPDEDPTSCAGHCGSTAPAGCYCTAGCKASGFCCPDFASTCACTPKCDGKTCGSDGCGGSCGTCGSDKPYCNASFQCDAVCVPACGTKACGPDGCGGTCGSCGAGSKCSKTAKCVPEAWTCSPLLYGDKQGCDCGCGAADSDCSVAGVAVFGCPSSQSMCTAKGVCDISFCANNAACGAKWCVGVYAKGNGMFGGVCDTPVSGGLSPGAGCSFDEECATLACLGGKCRMYCGGDGDCAATELCVGVPVAGTGLGSLGGFAAVCSQVLGSKKACATQSECLGGGETCVALVDAKTLGPRLVCAAVGKASAIGASCANFGCAAGQLCVPTANGFQCTLPCPGGAADCPSDWTCGQATFNGAGTADPADDPKVSVCLPK
jgi:hypothetical protein